MLDYKKIECQITNRQKVELQIDKNLDHKQQKGKLQIYKNLIIWSKNGVRERQKVRLQIDRKLDQRQIES